MSVHSFCTPAGHVWSRRETFFPQKGWRIITLDNEKATSFVRKPAVLLHGEHAAGGLAVLCGQRCMEEDKLVSDGVTEVSPVPGIFFNFFLFST